MAIEKCIHKRMAFGPHCRNCPDLDKPEAKCRHTKRQFGHTNPEFAQIGSTASGLGSRQEIALIPKKKS